MNKLRREKTEDRKGDKRKEWREQNGWSSRKAKREGRKEEEKRREMIDERG